jgi:hypothetical protein
MQVYNVPASEPQSSRRKESAYVTCIGQSRGTWKSYHSALCNAGQAKPQGMLLEG